MIERGDAIRRPVDNTLATREVHRGVSGMPVAQAEVLAQVRQQSPVLAVVVEQTALGSAQKPLFDLLLKVNDQWLQARTEQSFKPGTVLMIEAGPGNQLLALSRPDAAQLQQMMQASLSFWQAHTLPRVHPTELPPVPAPAVLNTLAQQHPNLAPLVQWLNQRSAPDSANLMRWVASFQPLGTERAPVSPTQSGAVGQLPGQPTITALTAGTPVAASSPGVGVAVPPPGASPPAPLPPLPGAQPLPQAISNTNAASEPGSTLKPMVSAALSNAPVLLQGNALLAAQSNLQTHPLPTRAQAVLNQALMGTSLPAAEAVKAVDPNSVPTGAQSSARGEPASNPTAPIWRDLVSPPGASVKSTANNPLPMEIRLGQWLAQIEQAVRQQPATVQEALAIKARQLLTANDIARPSQPLNITQPQASGQAARTETLEPLLQLRQLLEGVQAKVQNNAIQQSLSTLTQPDMPQVQQLSIPLIWLGVAAWANLEWWQEKRERKDEQNRRSGDRMWRFRLFLELKPLAPLCADLSWHNHEAQVIFWSQDPGTLNMLNQHMDQLTAWTEGLGERQFSTRHGMPPKKTTPKSDDFQPLVDVRT